MKLRVERVSVERFGQSRAEWNRLLDTMERPTTFCTWEWIHTWWKHFGEPYELLMLFLHRGDTLVGIFPLAARVEWVEDAVVPGRAVLYCGSREVFSDHPEVISAEADAAECLEAVIEFFRTEYRTWDLLHLSHVAEGSKLLEFTRQDAIPFERYERVASSAPFIPLEKGYAAFWETLSRTARHNLKRARSVLHEQLGGIYEASHGDTIPSAIRKLFDLHNRRATQKGSQTFFRGESLVQFHTEVASLSDEEGRLRLRFLRYGGKPVAVWYCFSLRDRIFAYQQGFDPEWAERSAARVLLLDLIEEACQDGVQELDLLRGGLEFKAHWTRHRRELFNVNLYNDTPVGKLIHSTDRGRSVLARRVKRLLRRAP